MAWKRVRQGKDRCSVSKKWNGEAEEAPESRHSSWCVATMVKGAVYMPAYRKHCSHMWLLLHLLSINSVWCWAIGEAIASSLMASVIEVHASFRRPLCYHSSHLSSISLTILPPLSPGFSPSPCFSFESKLLACHPSLLTASSFMRHYFLWPTYVSMVIFFNTCGCNNTCSLQQQLWRKRNFNLSMRMQRNEDLGATRTCVGVCSLLSIFWADHSQSPTTNMQKIFSYIFHSSCLWV